MIQSSAGIVCLALATCGTAAARANAEPPQFMSGQPASDWLASRLVPPYLDLSRARASLMPTVTRTRDSRASLSSRATTRSTRVELAAPSGLVTLDATRVRRSPMETMHVIGLRRDRAVIWSVAVGYQWRVGDNDSLRLAATMGAEKRKPAIAVADGHPTGTSTAAADLGWQHGAGLRLDAGWFAVAPLHTLTALDRTVALAGGSTIVERGYRASASIPFMPLAAHQARFGVRLATAAVDTRDLLALGASGRHDNRTSLFLGLNFR